MGFSFIEYRGCGFWSTNSRLKIWLRFLTNEIDLLTEVPGWLKEARDHWDNQASYTFSGMMLPGLDNFLTDPARVAVVEQLARRALARVHEQGPILSLESLDSLRFTPECGILLEDSRSEVLAVIGERFLQLLAGRLFTDASTSPTY